MTHLGKGVTLAPDMHVEPANTYGSEDIQDTGYATTKGS